MKSEDRIKIEELSNSIQSNLNDMITVANKVWGEDPSSDGVTYSIKLMKLLNTCLSNNGLYSHLNDNSVNIKNLFNLLNN